MAYHDGVPEEDQLRTIFNDIDRDGSGSIDAPEIRCALHRLGVRTSKTEVLRLLREADIDENGSLDLQEFTQFLRVANVPELRSFAQRWQAQSSVDVSDFTPPHHVPGLEVWQTALAGASGAAVAKTVTSPLERVKLAAQTRGLSAGMAGELRSILAHEGYHGFFAGNATNVLRAAPTGAIACTLYINLLSLTPADNELDAMEPVYRLTCAGTAACLANACTYPLDVVRTRLTLHEAVHYNGIADAIRTMIAKEGFGVFYRGLRPTLQAVVPFVAVQNATIDLTKEEASAHGIPVSYGVLVGAGALAGLTAQTLTFPLDVVRRRMQLPAEAPGALQASGTFDAMRQIVRSPSGFSGLFRGVLPAYCKTVPAVALATLVQVGLVGHFKAEAKRYEAL